jgi:hypothetical protein
MEHITLRQLAIDHDYYASGSNHYSQEASRHYKTWADFYADFEDADIDMNLVYRWDISEREASGRYDMQVTMIQQRKGIYMPIHIQCVDEKDVPQIIEFMKPHFEKLLSIWKPLSSIYSKPN